MAKKYLIVFMVYMLFVFITCGWLVIVVPSWWLRVLLVLDMVLIAGLVRYLKKLLS